MSDSESKREEAGGDAPERSRARPRTAREGEAVSGFPEPPGKDPGDRRGDPEPHHALSNPVEDPDETEWPDPYDHREDPREPPPDGELADETHPPSGAGSTSAPHPSQDPEAEPWEGPKRDKVDE